MNKLFTWLADVTVRRPALIMGVFVLLTIVAVIGVTRLHVRFQMRDMWDYPNNPLSEELDRYNGEFGDDGSYASVVIEAEDVFTPPVLRYIQLISRKLKRKPHFRRILSLSLNTIPRGRGDEVVTGPLFEHVPTDPKVLRQIRETALKSRMAVPRLVSKDGKYAMVAAEFKKPINQLMDYQKTAGNEAVRAVVESTPPPKGARVVLGGMSFAEAAGAKVIQEEQSTFLPIGLVLIVLVMVLSFGSWHGVVLTFTEVIVTVLWTLGFMGFMGLPFNMMSSSTPTILMVYGLLDSVFVMTVFYKLYEAEGRAGHERQEVREAVRRTIVRMGPVCLLTSVSTAIGFLSFAAGILPLVSSYGYGVAFGVIVAFFSSIIWMPALICVLPRPKKTRMRRSPLSRLFALALAGLGRAAHRRRWVIIAASVCLFVFIAVFLQQKTVVSMYTLKEAPQEMEGMEGNNLVADHLLGANSSGIAITGKPGSMQDPEVFKALDKLDTWAERSPAVTSSLSPSDLIRDMHRAFNGGSVKYDRIPDDRGLISQYLALLDPPTRTDFLTDDYAKTHLRVMCRDVGSHRWRHEIFEPMRKMALELFKGFKVEFPGYMRAVEGGSLLAVQQLIVGFLIAFGAIAILVGVAFRSARMALLSLLPNLLPTMAAMAGVVAAGQSLRVTTVLFLSVAVGITYDNTIHLYAGVRERLAGGMDHVQALRDTLEEVGPAIVFTSLLITGGLGIFMLSRVTWLVMMGLSSALVVLVAAVSDLLLTNALLGQWGHWLAPRARRR